MAKILVTGGAGFVGYHLCKKLVEKRNNSLTIVDNLVRGQMDDEFKVLIENDNIDFINADLTDSKFYKELARDYEYIYHLAAVIGVRNVLQNPDKVLYVNAISTLNIFEHAKGMRSLKKLLFSSTSEIYDGTLKNFGIEVPTDEEVPLSIADIKDDRTTYALSKMYGESICFVYGRKYEIPITIVRYHNVYGPRMGYMHVIPEMFIKIKGSSAVSVPSPDHTRAFCYIDDGIEATIRSCSNTDARNEIIHIGNQEEEIAIRDLVKTIAKVMGKEILIKEMPDTPGSTKRRCPEISKLKRLLGIKPQVSLEMGIAKTYEWYKDKLDLRYE